MKTVSTDKYMSITKESWSDILDQYEHFLFDDYLPFIEKYVFDHENGGFMCNTDRKGLNITTDKRTWYDGRGIWVYSYLFNHIDNNPAYLEAAQKTVDLVLKTKQPDQIFWPWSYDRLGNDLNENTPDIYGNLFVAEGLAEFSVATKNNSYWEKSKEILLNCVDIYDRSDYLYKLEYSPVSSVTHAERVLGHWMIMLRLSTNLLTIKEDVEIEGVSARCLDGLMNHHYNPKFRLMNEVLNHDLSQPEGELSQFVYIGHAIESLWMVMDEALRKKDEALFELAAERFKFHVEVAWDDVYGGVFHCLNHVDEYRWLTDKVLWAQQEVLVGLILLIEKRKDPWAIKWFEKVYAYVLETYPLEKHGYSLWNIGGNRKMDFVEAGVRIENYHQPRHLMLNILRIRNIINNQ